MSVRIVSVSKSGCRWKKQMRHIHVRNEFIDGGTFLDVTELADF